MVLDPTTERSLIEVARRAASRAHAPYSKFRVGAAALDQDGRITPGANVENASYGLTLCAERCAIFAAVVGGMTRLEAVVVYTPTAIATAPCGACRQVMQEFGPDARVIVVCDGEHRIDMSLADLFPRPFDARNLGN